MQSDELNRFWTREFGDSLPIADELKMKFDQRWFRIHTLPDSKRYADNAYENDEIIRRHNQILEDLFDSKENLILVSCSYSEKSEPTKNPSLKAIGLQENFWRTVNLNELENSEVYFLHLFVDKKRWKVGVLDAMLRLIANDEVDGSMAISIERRFVYHPYDGGADLILKDVDTRDYYKAKYNSWLSTHPDGL